jgi:hypothetical protein
MIADIARHLSARADADSALGLGHCGVAAIESRGRAIPILIATVGCSQLRVRMIVRLLLRDGHAWKRFNIFAQIVAQNDCLSANFARLQSALVDLFVNFGVAAIDNFADVVEGIYVANVSETRVH